MRSLLAKVISLILYRLDIFYIRLLGLAGSINARYLEAMDRRSGGHTDRRTYGQTVRGSGVQTARRQDGLGMSRTAYDDLKRSDAVQDCLTLPKTD